MTQQEQDSYDANMQFFMQEVKPAFKAMEAADTDKAATSEFEDMAIESVDADTLKARAALAPQELAVMLKMAATIYFWVPDMRLVDFIAWLSPLLIAAEARRVE